MVYDIENSPRWVNTQKGGIYMYRNLEAELSRYGIARKDIAAVLGLNVNTVSEKLSNPDRLKLKEAQTIRRTFFPKLTMEYLFDDGELSGKYQREA